MKKALWALFHGIFGLLPDTLKIMVLARRFHLEEKSFTISGIRMSLTVIKHSLDFGRDSGVDKEGQYEIAAGEKFIEALQRVETKHFLDVGGATGYYSVLASSIIPPENIHTFEPDIVQSTLLQLNNRKYCRGKIKVNRQYITNKVDRDQTTLDRYCYANNLSPGMIKMDIEGWEYYAIQGMRHVLDEHRPFIIIEFHERKLRQLFDIGAEQAAEAINQIAEAGYQLQYNGHHYQTNRQGGIPTREWVARPPNNINYAVYCIPK